MFSDVKTMVTSQKTIFKRKFVKIDRILTNTACLSFFNPLTQFSQSLHNTASLVYVTWR